MQVPLPPVVSVYSVNGNAKVEKWGKDLCQAYFVRYFTQYRIRYLNLVYTKEVNTVFGTL